MDFLKVPVLECANGILAHRLRLADGRVFKKGRRLDEADAGALATSGHELVHIARLAATDVPEDEAAHSVASRLQGAGVVVARPNAGRCDLLAARNGLLLFDPGLIVALNLASDCIGVSTLAVESPVRAGQRVATVKVMPFAVPHALLARALSCARPSSVLEVAPYVEHRFGLIFTRDDVQGQADDVRALEATRARLIRLGCELGAVRFCAHASAEIARALEALIEEGCSNVLIFATSAIVDERDVVPAAIASAGGRLVRFGVPIEPGNLLLLAEYRGARVIGVPRCGRLASRSGFDVILERVVAGLPLAPTDVARLGVGGLLQEKARPVAAEHRTAAVVLAAGMSRRMGSSNKLLTAYRRAPLVRHVVEQLLCAPLSAVLVVTGHQAPEVRAALAGLPVLFAHNSEYEEGLSSSVRTGITALGACFDSALLCPGDMPLLRAHHVSKLLRALQEGERTAVCVPYYGPRRGNPVLWPARYFEALVNLQGDVGARQLLQHASPLIEVTMDDDGVLIDLDTPSDFAKLSEGPRWDRQRSSP